jgi:serine/threonine-protein kinase RsbT
MEKNTELTLISGSNVTLVKRRKVALTQLYDNEVVIYIVRNILVETGFRIVDEFMVASAASELATNILRYAGEGSLEISVIKDTQDRIGIELFASDSGPGIQDLAEAMQDRLSTNRNSLGSGLPSVKRIMDEFTIESIPDKGTRVLARKWKQDGND